MVYNRIVIWEEAYRYYNSYPIKNTKIFCRSLKKQRRSVDGMQVLNILTMFMYQSRKDKMSKCVCRWYIRWGVIYICWQDIEKRNLYKQGSYLRWNEGPVRTWMWKFIDLLDKTMAFHGDSRCGLLRTQTGCSYEEK